MGSHPDATRYQELIETLFDIERRTSTADISPLAASYESLSAVIGFLYADPEVVERESARPLYRLMIAIYDTMRGAKPKLLFEPASHPGREDHKGAPTHLFVNLLRGHVVAAFLLLRESGMSSVEAGKWLAAELKRSAVKSSDGKIIDAKIIIRWRRELGGKSPKGSDDVFRLILESEMGKAPAIEDGELRSDSFFDRSQAQACAQTIIKRLRIMGF
jgi:hypothetical protein